MEYKFAEIEEKWKKFWAEKDVYKVTEDSARPKFYVLDMFPYPSGSGLHVGHPLGYVASDIYARYKRLSGFNVLHPMGYDAFGLPAEQYAIETGTHPAITTEKAIKRYREQLDKIGFSFDWSRSVKTSDPGFYKWTQWIFLKLFNSWYNRETNKAEPIETLIAKFEQQGCLPSSTLEREGLMSFTFLQWNSFHNEERQKILMHYRLAFLSYAEVNWCPALGTVLANDEVKDGKSERGGYPVERKRMRQWFLRITEYSDRLLEGLNKLDWSESMKEMQRNWIGKSEGALVNFTTSHLSQTLSEGEGLKRPRYYTTDGQKWNHNIKLAKEGRANPTEAETIVWQRLKATKTGFKFRRQHPIDSYIPDFVCLERGLVVEIDGKIHLKQIEEDKIRTAILSNYGFEVLRFTNEEVIGNIDGVIATITAKLSKMGKRKVLSFGEDLGEVAVSVFTTRPDTIFGATFLVIAAEHELVPRLTTPEQKLEVEKYLTYVKSRTDVERQQEKKVTGVFTGSYAVNPFTGVEIPVWIAEYVLSGYGTGAIMAVPADDERDRKFAEKFNLPIVDIIDKSMYPGSGIEDKVGKMINSGFLDGMEVKDAIQTILEEIEDLEIGQRKVNYKQRDASFSRQRYWGEPIPIRFKRNVTKDDQTKVSPFGGDLEGAEGAGVAIALNEDELPLLLPEVSSYKSTGDGKSPLANNKEWVEKGYETDIMPGYAGSSWYCLRYMDAHNNKEFAAKDKMNYWQNVDLYVGGAEHAVGHLLYARLWHNLLFDLGLVPTSEPFKKLVNQGMIQGRSSFVYRLDIMGPILEFPGEIFISKDIVDKIAANEYSVYKMADLIKEQTGVNIEVGDDIKKHPDIDMRVSKLHVEIELVDNDILDVEKFKKHSRHGDENTLFLLNGEGKYICGHEVEKMSKSKYNVVNPDDVIEKYGADCFRMFEMFLGPIEQSKPWDDKGISGTYNFLRKFWRLFYDDNGAWKVSKDEPVDAEYKVLHKTLKKISEDIERLSFNTAVSAFMICINELHSLNCSKQKILEPLVIALASFAPFITEELWEKLGNKPSVHHTSFPKTEEKYLVENAHEYPVSVNGKLRAHISLPLDISQDEVQKQVMELEHVKKWTNGSPVKKFIFVKGKIINVVV